MDPVAYWTMVLAFTTIASTMITALLVFLAFKELKKNEQNTRLNEHNTRLNERNTRFNVYKSVMDMLEKTKEIREKINRTITMDKKARVKNEEFENPEYELVIRQWDQLAYLIKREVVPEEFVMDYYSLPLVTSWLFLNPIVMNEREKQHRPRYQKKFQDLADDADTWRVAKGKQTKKLITIIDE